MTHPRSPSAGELIDIMVVDAEIEALRRGIDQADDRASLLLLGLRDSVDTRAAAILGLSELESDPRACGVVDPEPLPLRATRGGAAPEPHRLSRRARLAVLPLTGALVLGSTGVAAALSRSPHAPFYGLHRFIFGPAPSSDAQLTRDLAGAADALERAAALTFTARVAPLARAQLLLSAARDLLPQASTAAVRRSFQDEITREAARLTALARPPARPAPAAQPSIAAPLPTPSAASGATILPPVDRTSPDDAAPATGTESGTESGIESGTESGTESEAPESTPATATSQAPATSEAPAAPLPPAGAHTGAGETDEAPEPLDS